jgi:hypothetical protein
MLIGLPEISDAGVVVHLASGLAPVSCRIRSNVCIYSLCSDVLTGTLPLAKEIVSLLREIPKDPKEMQ